MKKVSEILKDFKIKIFKNEDRIFILKKIIENKLKINLEKEKIIFLKNSCKIEAHPLIKYEIKNKKREIIKELKKNNIFLENIY